MALAAMWGLLRLAQLHLHCSSLLQLILPWQRLQHKSSSNGSGQMQSVTDQEWHMLCMPCTVKAKQYKPRPAVTPSILTAHRFIVPI